ncbi:hypothetical protein [Pontibacter diazotrophicus]|nr:hypothetical protein [Pontibacter diazotrophicus]
MGGFFAEALHSVADKRVMLVYEFNNTWIQAPYLEEVVISELIKRE